ncbi:class I SAM-dependent methyltransferase [Candidatus Pseudomonas adelgestsugas]|uniref:Ribosomal RNA small subunit methyltransferase J n=1 Tax=Candidatus Pseudomonas adelgestsugas TaxID=1302376 RepID=A0ABX5R8T3_9PSED|nr:class I SAM-dependent methyltransferase [Candidatus Pseudomonas adelgestsugas]QAX81832.1 Ribosomal RNA small subunit methyltransferase J [Candidatus Pseudomonas adelgestsugas]
MTSRIRVEALVNDFQARAEHLAAKLGLPLQLHEADFSLQVSKNGLQLQKLGYEKLGPVHVDFVNGGVAHRRLYGGGSGQMIAKAIGVNKILHPRILDGTAGMGKDAFLLASLGCEIILIERQPLIGALLEDGLARGASDSKVAPIIARMRLLKCNSIEVMLNWKSELPQVIYLDPMFPHRKKTALMKKDMRLFRPIVGDDEDAPALLAAALALAIYRVVVKRPRKASCIEGPKRSYALVGKSNRYDVYHKKTLKS